MKRFALALVLLTGTLSAYAGWPVPEWGYSAPSGPAQWGNLPGSTACSMGADQSPIAIESGEVAGLRNAFSDNSLPLITPQWSDSSMTIVNNGHTLQVVYAPGSTIDFEDTQYELKQFHFHSPSEHMLNERQYPLEVHFVHQTPAGQLLVVGVFFKVGAANAALESIWANAPTTPETTVRAPQLINGLSFLPAGATYFTYGGSLTTPPCSEGVRWIVMKEPVEASPEQLRFLQKTMGFTNNRPVQPLDGRGISIGADN